VLGQVCPVALLDARLPGTRLVPAVRQVLALTPERIVLDREEQRLAGDLVLGRVKTASGFRSTA
jgi:hypothetical protein